MINALGLRRRGATGVDQGDLSAEPDGRTMIERRHEQPDRDSWRTYGPGAGGVGW
ncbi:hypothetical protein [Microlunatus parietis]|uniref:Uncharacterized protein n=1 Tax=Microlunatus parietis TaxID=682979 RepID=A0A7Y9IDR5_9ACTN|nr:hypothetical protein [Microlunatus parietis]NYE74997.1 hypothetical protein [Microlunatus parietis]